MGTGFGSDGKSEQALIGAIHAIMGETGAS
jgi:hypothetical protein